MKPIRILQAVGGMNRGGLETWALNVLKNIDRTRFQIDFLVDTNDNYHYNDEVKALGSRIIPCKGYRRPPAYWQNFKSIYREHGPYDIVHSHVHYFSGVILAIAARLGVQQRIAHVHPPGDLKPPSLSRSLYRVAMMKSISLNATAVLACSKTTLDAFVENCRPRTKFRQILYNGVDVASFDKQVDVPSIRHNLGLPLDQPVVVYVARFMPHKNYRQMLRLALRCSAAGVRAHFVLAGSHGTELDDIKRQVSNMSNVSLLLGLPDVSELLLASDLFFFPSLEEGFGVVALEAACAGLPVVASGLPSIKEALCPSQRDLAFTPNDDEGAFKSLTRVLSDDKLHESLATEGRAWAREFSILKSTQAIADVYDRLATSTELTQVA